MVRRARPVTRVRGRRRRTGTSRRSGGVIYEIVDEQLIILVAGVGHRRVACRVLS
jgi:hypothetical protein